MSEYKKEHPGSGQEEYYDRLPRVQIVYKAEESDLAIISFQSEKQLSVVPVSDKIAPGSSGSAVYNEEMELIGINIGGGRDIFGRFRHGVMIPVDQIRECLQNGIKSRTILIERL